MKEVAFEPKSGTGARGQGKSPRGTAFQAEGRAWTKVLRCAPVWHWKNSLETGVAGVSTGEVEGEKKGEVRVFDDSLKSWWGRVQSGPQALTICSPWTGANAAGGESLMAPVGAGSCTLPR